MPVLLSFSPKHSKKNKINYYSCSLTYVDSDNKEFLGDSLAKVYLPHCLSYLGLFFIQILLLSLQVAGLPTNISFLQSLANHWAFEKGLVETHFIEHFKNDLFIDSADEVAAEAYAAAKLGASLVAACICEKEHVTLKETLLGMFIFSIMLWHAGNARCSV